MSVHTKQLEIEIRLHKLATEIEALYQEIDQIGTWLYELHEVTTPEQQQEHHTKSMQISGLHNAVDKKLAVLGSYVLEARELKLARLLLFSEGE